ncbi:MAG: hypothetical protein HY804_08975 [Nitrospinae bacterium]|nr:hypothetical protein [Nitrospinota bacterium]
MKSLLGILAFAFLALAPLSLGACGTPEPPGYVALAEDNANPSPTDPGATQIFSVGNLLAVYNGGTAPSFTTEVTFRLTEVWTYHWNNGAGAAAGTIALQRGDGSIMGPWATTLYNSVYWVARPDVILPAGTYTVIDSDPSTLAQNADTGGVGMAWAYGYVQ